MQSFRTYFMVLAALLFMPLYAACPVQALETGKGMYVYEDKDTGKTIPVWYHKPASATPDTPVVFVMHGTTRTATSYRNAWSPLAEQYGFIVLAPEFSRADFPGSRTYHLGNVFQVQPGQEKKLTALGPKNPREQWTIAFPEKLFDDFRAHRENSKQTRYYLYGHSAGGHFVLRAMLFEPQSRVILAIAANPGWYTTPDMSIPWPYGFKNSGVTEAELAHYFSRPLVLLMGEADNDPQGKYVVHNVYADAQGLERFSRSKSFFAATEAKAGAMGVPLAWQYQSVPDIGHTNKRMAVPAAAIFAKAMQEAK